MVELLAPVRDEVSFTAALDAGADAVYFGLGHLNMRINSKGIDLAILPDIVQRAHDRNVKVYVTLNAIIYDEEMQQLDDLLRQIKQADVDAVICWDFAVIEKVREYGIELHISTQASISNTSAAKFYHSLGATRVVLARELTLDQIKEVKKNTPLEIEVFIHGAMCVSVSGRCFMSQFLYNHSANRGDCIQPCRREFTITDPETNDQLEISNGYVLSPKDLCTLPVIDQLIEAGIDSLKIEGRSRPPEYIKAVVSAYRRAIDAVQAGTFNKELVETLMTDINKVYHRGFSKGFLMGRPSPTDWTDRYGSQATQRKVYTGKILNYYDKAQIILAQITSHPLKVGDLIQIHGPTTGVVEFTITELQTDEQGSINEIDKGKVTFPCPPLVRRNDKIYIIQKIEPNQ